MSRRTSLRILLSVTLVATAAPAAFPAAAAPDNTRIDRLSWGPCPEFSQVADSAECTEITVPRDYADPNGPTIALTMSRIPATGERRGVIAGNPGGPGGDALGMFSDADAGTPAAEGHVVLPPDVREHHDLIALEPRGLTWGTPLDCPVPPMLASNPGAVHTACDSADPGYVSTVTTDNTARDLDEARKALGEDRLNLYGVSYGGMLMATYATLFPEHTDRTLLDSPASPEQRWFGIGAARKQARVDGLNAMFSWLAERDDEYHLGTTPLQVYQRWSLTVSAPYGVQLPTTPPAAQDDDLPAGSSALPGELGLQVTDAVVTSVWRGATLLDATRVLLGDPFASTGVMVGQSGLMLGLYNQNLWPLIGEQLRDPAAAAAQAQAEQDQRPAPTEEETAVRQQIQVQLRLVEQAVICNENTIAPDTSLILPTMVTEFTGGDLIRYNEDFLASGRYCTGWPVPTPPVRLTGAKLDRAPLTIGYTHDTAVTSAGASDMRRAMGGELVTVDGYSHAVLGVDPELLAGTVSDYFA